MIRRSILLSNMSPLDALSVRRLLVLITLGLLPLGLAISLGTFWLLSQPTGTRISHSLVVPPGASAQQIGDLLEREKLIHSASVFTWIVRIKGLGHQLKAGIYQLDGNRTTEGIIQDLLKAPIYTQRATIPEGLTRHQIAGHLQLVGIADSVRFVVASEDPDLIRQLGIEAVSLEGYLFPETYFLDLKADESDIVKMMVAQFRSVFADSLIMRLSDLNMSLHEVVTLASIVEREAFVASERPVIAGVFQHRLKLNRRLESCATVEYALGIHKKRLTRADLQVKSPFNTYRHRGLPPGPIGNPGRAAILATLYPVETEYLYFVARGDGTHIFSRTNKEHERAKRQIKKQERLARQAQARRAIP